jgi:carboxymethylenebutenolidase
MKYRNLDLRGLTLIGFMVVFLLFLAACSAPAEAPATTTATTTTPTIPTPASSPSPTASSTTPSPPGYVSPEAVADSEVTFSGDGLNIKAYLAKPGSAGTFPGLLIIHENRGLTPHIQDVARRFANQGYVALAPDLLSRVGGTAQFATSNEAVAAIGTLSSDNVVKDLNSAFVYLQSVPGVQKDRIGVIGYCWGGGNSLLFATRNNAVKAAIVYYGPILPISMI